MWETGAPHDAPQSMGTSHPKQACEVGRERVPTIRFNGHACTTIRHSLSGGVTAPLIIVAPLRHIAHDTTRRVGPRHSVLAKDTAIKFGAR